MPKCSALPQILALLGGIAFAACQWLVFAYAPEEVTLGLAQKIFYIHLPMSRWALVSFFVVFGASVAYLWRRNPAADRLAAAAEPGVANLSSQTVPQVNQLVADLRDVSQQMGALAAKLDEDPLGALTGGRPLPDYDPKGEK